MTFIFLLLMIAIVTTTSTTATTTLTTKNDMSTEGIICSKTKRCTDADMAQWLMELSSFQWRLGVIERSGDRRVSFDGDQVEKLCVDERGAGFLLDDDALAWSIACVWMGGENETVDCSPAPPGVFGYISREQWRRKLMVSLLIAPIVGPLNIV